MKKKKWSYLKAYLKRNSIHVSCISYSLIAHRMLDFDLGTMTLNQKWNYWGGQKVTTHPEVRLGLSPDFNKSSSFCHFNYTATVQIKSVFHFKGNFKLKLLRFFSLSLVNNTVFLRGAYLWPSFPSNEANDHFKRIQPEYRIFFHGFCPILSHIFIATIWCLNSILTTKRPKIEWINKLALNWFAFSV